MFNTQQYALVKNAEGNFVYGEGPFTSSDEPAESGVSFYLNNYDLTNQNPWLIPNSWRLLDKTDLINFQNNFTLYLSLENLSDLFSENGFLIMFWCHFLAVNLFCGAWIVSDSIKLSISKFLTFFPLLITYFIGPLGLFIYWLIRIFFARRMSLYD